MSPHRQLIGGEWVDAAAGGTWDLIDPGTGEVVEQVPFGNEVDARLAIDAAADAGQAWANTNPFERARLLMRAAEVISERAERYAAITTGESGKPFAQAKAEWASAPNYLVFAAEEAKRLGGRIIPARTAGRRIDVTYRPLGVVGVITAWNFPVYNVNRAVSSALAAGCTVVVRPSEYTPRSAMLYGEALHDAGIPPGVINVVSGEPGPMGQAMLDDSRVRKIGFTGSVRVGKLLMDGASRTVTKLSLELGGNAPVIVFPDVKDLEAVASSGVTAKYRNCGQVCIAPQRFLVHASIIDRFTEAAAAASEREVVGHGMDPASTVGPLINAVQRDRVEQIVARSAAAGARVVTGGTPIDGPGFFYRPTVVADLPADAPLATEEVFGPVLPIIPFETADEAVTMANSVDYGLASFVWTRDLATAMTVSEGLDFGMVGINDWYPVTPEAPFGGTKQSGMGRESGLEGLHEYVEAKTRYFGGLQ
ncbi:MAG: NAD-dependent succinate-semialdehyde dehydrogenase [Acidimicrobiia bacterium]|nr:NAD-dependent succinate-semialdehyde dehydrogenase [Acidimicrobiia bacterium]